MTNAAPVLASVIVLAIQDYARKAVREQVELKRGLDELVRAALQPVPAAQRIVLEAPQGLAVALLDRPRVALNFVEHVQAHGRELPLCVGINHGPVTVATDAERGRSLIGDGVAAALAMAQAASPGRVIASRAFRDALKFDAPADAARLGGAGTHTDAHLRVHELFSIDRRAARARRWRIAFTGVLACAAILALGGVARFALLGSGLRVPPAVIELEIEPRGVVYIDGVLKGTTPPLLRIEVRPGPHVVEIRSEDYPPLLVQVNPAPEEQMTIAHVFERPQPPPVVAAPERSHPEKSLGDSLRDGWRDFRRTMGF